ncbi:MAG: anaerobic ribonucleoside-triphosphate reductase activating protein [Candidatus Hydrogenedentes bacterium]|nr:anaerobic ribonucleoside-triphosphate reductase activating protein [Candidatus Hydrogenedentota bacterium]
MLFGGFQPFTLSDYPSCIAAIAFAQGCNFRCRFCHNASLLPMLAKHDELLSSEDILAKLAPKAGKLEGLVVSGGEPTLHQDLPDFLDQVKRLGFKIKLDTNGSRPIMLAEVLRLRLIDYIAMDVKGPLADYSRICGVPVVTDAIRESISLVAGAGIAHHFRTTFSEQLMSSADLDRVKSTVPEGSKHITQAFQPQHALDPTLRPSACAS